MNKESAEVVVIGGGVRGMAVAYYLKKAGVDVIVLEKRFVGAGASGLSMGYVNISGKGPIFYTEFSKMSADMYPTLNEELDGKIEYERNGSVSVAQTEKEWEELAEVADERNRVEDVNMCMLDIAKMREMEPALSPHLLGGYWCPVDGGVNPLKLTRTLASEAARKGACIYTGCEVLDILSSSGRIEGVITNKVSISTHIVVNAAGIHVPQICGMAGIHVPVFPERGQLTITEPLPKFLNHTVGSYKQFENGQVLMGVTNERVGENTSVTTRMISSRVRLALEILPGLKAVRGIRCAAALRPMTPDRLPIYQKMEGVSDLYLAVGHSGFTLAPITGKIFSELITQGHTDVAIDEYRIERFNEKEEDSE